MDEHPPLTAELLFERYFWPVYPDDARTDLARARTLDANPAANRHILRSLDEIAETFVAMASSVFETKDLGLDGSDASVHRLSALMDRPRRDRWTKERAPDGTSLLTHVVVHGAIYVGACVISNHGATWQVRRPLWESLVRLRSAMVEADLAVFHWCFKSNAASEIESHTPEAATASTSSNRPCAPSFRPIAAEPRVPRLSSVRYDAFYKHVRAHFPEMRDLGDHFPSAERLSELSFRHLDFTWLGGTRMLLLHGPADRGVHLFWLDRSGFAKAAYYPADPGSEYRIDLEGDTLCVAVTVNGRPADHVMLWWGP
jgi:hypothetical protein